MFRTPRHDFDTSHRPPTAGGQLSAALGPQWAHAVTTRWVGLYDDLFDRVQREGLMPLESDRRASKTRLHVISKSVKPIKMATQKLRFESLQCRLVLEGVHGVRWIKVSPLLRHPCCL